MPTFELTVPHALSLDDARRRVEDLLRQASDAYDLKVSWEGADVARFDRRGLDGSARVARADVRVAIDLAFLLRPFRGRIERELRDRLVAALR